MMRCDRRDPEAAPHASPGVAFPIDVRVGEFTFFVVFNLQAPVIGLYSKERATEAATLVALQHVVVALRSVIPLRGHQIVVWPRGEVHNTVFKGLWCDSVTVVPGGSTCGCAALSVALPTPATPGGLISASAVFAVFAVCA
jgi:hypothetical protein